MQPECPTSSPNSTTSIMRLTFDLECRYNLLFVLSGGGKLNYFGIKSFLEEQLEDPGAKVKYSESYIFTYFSLSPHTTNAPPPPSPYTPPMHLTTPPLQHAHRFLPPSQCRLHPMSRLSVCPTISTLSTCLQTSPRGFTSLSTGAGSQSGEWGVVHGSCEHAWPS